MTIEQANSYFEALPDGFASTDQLRAALPASAQKVQFVGVAGTAGKTAVLRGHLWQAGVLGLAAASWSAANLGTALRFFGSQSGLGGAAALVCWR